MTKLLWRLFSELLHCAHFGLPNVNLGLMADMNPRLRHGVLHARCMRSGQFVKISYRVDNPRFLFWPRQRTVDHLFNQARKMGLEPRLLTCSLHNRAKTYAPSTTYRVCVPVGRYA